MDHKQCFYRLSKVCLCVCVWECVCVCVCVCVCARARAWNITCKEWVLQNLTNTKSFTFRSKFKHFNPQRSKRMQRFERSQQTDNSGIVCCVGHYILCLSTLINRWHFSTQNCGLRYTNTVIPRLTSDLLTNFSANKDFFRCFSDSANECFSGCVR